MSSVQKGVMTFAVIAVAVLLIGGYCLNAYITGPEAELPSAPNPAEEEDPLEETEPSAPPLRPTPEAELLQIADVQEKLDETIAVDFDDLLGRTLQLFEQQILGFHLDQDQRFHMRYQILFYLMIIFQQLVLLFEKAEFFLKILEK